MSRKLIANLGDVNPIEHGGFFVFVNKETGDEDVEVLDLEFKRNPKNRKELITWWRIYQFSPNRCTYINSILSDNPDHPEIAAWFAKSLEEAARNQDVGELRADLCSEDVVTRAGAYQVLIGYHGEHCFDEYPLTITDEEEVEKRYEIN